MMTFSQKIEFLQSFPELNKKELPDGRVNFYYANSRKQGKVIVRELYPPTGNGYLCGRYMSDFKVDARGWINIRDVGKEQLRTMVLAAISSMSK
ncbi:hypothetical protein [Alicyclobacillus fodiniaquatilis]|jgi:hypothetical protein|uniref:Uncharacterized protein n=1 Tax=Alicyclobacillus fodiniaquatilis TaxID=1661150 RepID=A0ABW4JLJ6_9BACL